MRVQGGLYRGGGVESGLAHGGSRGALLPHRRQMERLDQQHIAELAGADLDCGPRIECPTVPLLASLTPRRGNAACDIPQGSSLGDARLDGLLSPTQGTANKHRAKQSPKVLVDTPCQSRDALLIGDRRLPQVHRAPIRERQCETDRRQSLIAIEQRTALVM